MTLTLRLTISTLIESEIQIAYIHEMRNKRIKVKTKLEFTDKKIFIEDFEINHYYCNKLQIQ